VDHQERIRELENLLRRIYWSGHWYTSALEFRDEDGNELGSLIAKALGETEHDIWAHAREQSRRQAELKRD
jgi:hypothetical protein